MTRSSGSAAAAPSPVRSPRRSSPATVTALRAQHAEIVRREAELTAKLGPRHPAVAEIRAQARDLRRLINEEIARIGQAAYNDLVRARSAEAALSRSLEETKREATATNEALVRLRELQREADSSRAVYEAFLMRARETGEQQRIDTTNVRVISKAEPPQYRASPPRNLILLMIALVIGIGAGIGLAFFRERTDDRITSPLGLASMTGWPTLAVLPDIKGSLRRWSQRGPMAPAETPAADVPNDKADSADAPFATELRALRDVFGNRPPPWRERPPPVRRRCRGQNHRCAQHGVRGRGGRTEGAADRRRHRRPHPVEGGRGPLRCGVCRSAQRLPAPGERADPRSADRASCGSRCGREARSHANDRGRRHRAGPCRGQKASMSS